jgi:hypothetical protein
LKLKGQRLTALPFLTANPRRMKIKEAFGLLVIIFFFSFSAHCSASANRS